LAHHDAKGLRWGQTDEAHYKICERRMELFWALVRTPAELQRQINDKLTILLAYDDQLDRTTRAMLESIRADVEGLREI
jgi:hypothetical protein